MLTDFHNYFTVSVRLSDNFATEVDQSYCYGFGGLVFLEHSVCNTFSFSCVRIEWANCPQSRQSVQ